MDASDTTVRARLPETFCWLLVPVQQDPHGSLEWQEIRLQGNNGLVERASRRLLRDELLIVQLAGTRLRMELDRVPLWRGDHVEVRQLIEDFARYVYLPRLRDHLVLVKAVEDGVALPTWEQDTFAYADSYDEATSRYGGLRAGQQIQLSPDNPRGLVVKPEAARRQMDVEARDRSIRETGSPDVIVIPGPVKTPTPIETPPQPSEAVLPRRFHGNVELNPLRVGADAGRIAQEVIAHLAGLRGAQVRVTLEIEATIPEGIPEDVKHRVTENCRTLKFMTYEFEME
jgi:hypothetical protein